MNENLIDLMEYVFKNSPIEKQDLIKGAAAGTKISERTVRRNIDLLQKRGIIKSTNLEYNAGKLLEVSDSFKNTFIKPKPEGGDL